MVKIKILLILLIVGGAVIGAYALGVKKSLGADGFYFGEELDRVVEKLHVKQDAVLESNILSLDEFTPDQRELIPLYWVKMDPRIDGSVVVEGSLGFNQKKKLIRKNLSISPSLKK